MKALLEDYSKDIGAGKTVTINASGSTFLCSSTTSAKVQAKFGSTGNEIPIVAGLKIKLPDKDTFDRVTLKNYDNVTATVKCYIGTVDIDLTKLT